MDITPEQVFASHKQMGLSDLDAALKTRDYLQKAANANAGMAKATDFFTSGMSGKGVGDQTAYREQQMKQANQPLEDAALKAQANYGEALADPSHPTNQVLQALVKQHLPGVPTDKLTVYDAENLGGPMKMLGDYAKQMGEAASSQATAGKTLATTQPEVAHLGAQTAAEAAGAEEKRATTDRTRQMTPVDVAKGQAEAAKTGAETGQIAPNAETERGLKTAQTGKEEAEAAKLRMETGGEIAPGWSRGNIPIAPDEAKEFRTKSAALDSASKNIKDIFDLLGPGGEVLLDPKKRAQAIPKVKNLILELKKNEAVRGLPPQDIKLFESMVGDPTKMGPMDLVRAATGIAHNRDKMLSFLQTMKGSLDSDAKSKGLVRTGGGGVASDEHARAIKWAQDNPKDPRSAEILGIATKAVGGVTARGAIAGQ